MFVVLLVMKRAVVLLFMSLTLGVVTGSGAFQTLPHFEFNGKNKSHWIINRIPDYGDGHRDGCIVSGEWKVSLKETSQGVYEGEVRDREDDEFFTYATLIINDGTKEKRELRTDQYGKFSFQYTLPIQTISFKGTYQRELRVIMR